MGTRSYIWLHSISFNFCKDSWINELCTFQRHPSSNHPFSSCYTSANCTCKTFSFLKFHSNDWHWIFFHTRQFFFNFPESIKFLLHTFHKIPSGESAHRWNTDWVIKIFNSAKALKLFQLLSQDRECEIVCVIYFVASLSHRAINLKNTLVALPAVKCWAQTFRKNNSKSLLNNFHRAIETLGVFKLHVDIIALVRSLQSSKEWNIVESMKLLEIPLSTRNSEWKATMEV